MAQRAVFKAYRQHQATFLPPSLEDLIPQGHLVRVVSQAIDGGVVRRELAGSKQRLEDILGTEVLSFAYPYGALDTSVKEMVAEVGYRYAAAADFGPTALHDDFLEIRRTQVFPWTGVTGFWKKTLPVYSHYKNIKDIR